MPLATHPASIKVPFWKRFIQAIKAYEDSMEFSAFERSTISHQKRIADLELKVSALETAHHALDPSPHEPILETRNSH